MENIIYLTNGTGILGQFASKFMMFFRQDRMLDGLMVYLTVHLLMTFFTYLATVDLPIRCLRIGKYESSRWQRAVDFFRVGNRRMLLMFGLIYLIYIPMAVFRGIAEGLGGIDAYAYQKFFLAADCSFSEFRAMSTQEVSYLLFVWLVRMVTDDFRVVLWIVHSAALACFFYFCVNRPFKKGGVLDFLCLFLIYGFLFNMFNILRSILSMGFVLVWLVQVEKKQYLRSIPWLLLSMGAHIASVIMVPIFLALLFLEKIKTKTATQVLGWVVLGVAVEFVAIKVLLPIFSSTGRLQYYGNSSGISLGTYMMVFVMCAAIWIRDKQLRRNTPVRTDCWIILMAWICLPIQLEFSVAYRMVLLFMPVIYRLVPKVVASCSKKNLVNFGMKFAIIAYICLRLYLLYFNEFPGDGLYPYVFRLNG